MKARESISNSILFPRGSREREAFGCAVNIISFCVDDDENEKREKKRNERAHLGVFLFSSLDERKRVVSAAHIMSKPVFAREENEVKKDVPCNNEKSDAIHV